jgi:hypothetical protein
MSWSTWRRVVAHQTEPSAAAVERVRARVHAAAASTATALQSAEPALDPRAEARVRAALRARVRARRPALGWLALGGGVAFAFAGGAWWLGAPAPALPSAAPPAAVATPATPPDAEALTAATWLARANAGLAAGDPQGALDATHAGMPLADAAIAGELLAVQADAWLALGQPSEARAAAEAYLAQANRPRATEMRHLAGDLALTAGDCAAAERWLSDLGDLSASEAAHLARCATP